MTTLEAARLRANPGYEAVPFNRLASGEHLPADSLAMAPDDYGVLVPLPGSRLAPVAICRETALLFLTLRTPGPPPDFVLATPAGEGKRVLRQLLLDCVLEIEGPDGFVSGMAASALLGLSTTPGAGTLAELSQAALRYAAALATADPIMLTRKLYCYNRRPETMRLRRAFATQNDIRHFLKLDRARAGWTETGDGHDWFHFTATRQAPTMRGGGCKLYVGLDMAALADGFDDIVAALARSEAGQFKVGADLGGMLRPDKFVAYFTSKEALLDAAQRLLPIIAGRKVQGVPFTAGIAPNGALSWGSDPVARAGELRMSWRQWLCERLAASLVTARHAPARDVEPWRFALERLSLDGVDPQSFTPTAIWPEVAT
jgi:hypothetical protein